MRTDSPTPRVGGMFRAFHSPETLTSIEKGPDMFSFRFPVILVFSLIACPLSAQVRTWVSSTGLDSNDCSRSSPCRNFGAAITAVAVAGEVVVLDSAGYGPVDISKSVSVIAPAGVHAAIAPTTGAAIEISAAGVVIRGLYLNGQGAGRGFLITGAATNVHIENCVISGFTSQGLYMVSTVSARLYVLDSVFRLNVNVNSDAVGVMIQGITVVNTATLEHCRFDGNNSGVLAANNARITVHDSIATGGNIGFRANSTTQGVPAEINLENCVAAHLGVAFSTTGLSTLTTMTIANSAAFSSIFGVSAEEGGTIRIGGTTVSRNTYGLFTNDGGTIISFGNNHVDGNVTNGAPTSTIGTI